jgi:hypothetical protein
VKNHRYPWARGVCGGSFEVNNSFSKSITRYAIDPNWTRRVGSVGVEFRKVTPHVTSSCRVEDDRHWSVDQRVCPMEGGIGCGGRMDSRDKPMADVAVDTLAKKTMAIID